ncbi:diacylglycerol/lipid kinase family protein [Saccharopolyspora rectivirgula]|uniref:diacylglycerol/lipid kinase family protein n=1 Tax=Saccharopolyspora rectivirgula TaxID=28042 RepID=UPI002409A3CA|nr:diacylglycerol kinase family protein [Saccharopolyspora rectivirgula]
MRAALVVNPQATSTTAAGRDVLAHALASELKLDVVEVCYRGHAADAARTAVADGADLVIAHGGDGTVNEVVNGLLEASRPGDPDMPALGVVPGGLANVFARALGLSKDPVEATHLLLQAVTHRRFRWVGLGRADDRWFTFNAGVGLDAEAVARVEQARRAGRSATSARYARAALQGYFQFARQDPPMALEIDGEPAVDGLYSVFVANTDPWTYLGPRPVRLSPQTGFDNGLGLLALRSLTPHVVLQHVADLLRGSAKLRGAKSIRRANAGHVRVICQRPLRWQVDGDCLGERSEIHFRAVPTALRVAA